MTKRNSLTKSEVLSALKEAGVATKNDVREIFTDEIQKRGLATKHDVREIIGEEITKRGLATKDDVQQIVGEEITKRRVATKDDISKSENRLKRFVRTEIRSVRADVAKLATDTPTRNEFNKLKNHVDQYFPTV